MNDVAGSSRFHRRRLVARLTSLRWWILALVALAVVGICAWVLLFSAQFAAEEVAVHGDSTVSVQAVQSAADVSMGTPLLRLDLNEIRDRVASLPAVQSVTVNRSWPHTVSISITERQPVAAIHRGGHWWVMDVQGVLFQQTRHRAEGLPVVAVRSSAGSSAVVEAASVISSLPADLLAETKRLTARSMDSITLRLTSKSSVIWGSSAESDRKVEVLQALRRHVDAPMYDVSVPGQPTTSN